MKRSLWMAMLVLALPAVAFASSIDYTTNKGLLSSTGGGTGISGSLTITEVNGNANGNYGSIAFSDTYASGSFLAGGILNTGGSIKITDKLDGLVFNGTFSCGAGQQCDWAKNGNFYSLTADIAGELCNSSGTNCSSQIGLSFVLGGKFNSKGQIIVSSGDTSVNTPVPEPGSLSLLGTGLIGLAGLVRRKIRA